MDFNTYSKCPCCSSGLFDIYSVSATQFSVKINGEDFNHPAYSLIQCSNCSLVYKSSTPSYSRLNEYYKKLDYRTYDNALDFPTDKFLKESIRGVLNQKMKILDYGCGAGRILKEFSYENDCFGVELNEVAAAEARLNGLQIIGDENLDSGIYNNFFDIIVLADVFEHLYTPLETLKIFAKCLKKGGVLLISTGNSQAIPDRHIASEFWYWRIFSHLQMLNEKHVLWLKKELLFSNYFCKSVSHYNVSLIESVKQFLYYQSYNFYKKYKRSFFGKIIFKIPKISRISKWNNAPSIIYLKDHFIVALIK